MNSKKIIFALVFALLCSVFSANAVDYYKVYQPSFTNEPAENIYVTGGVCGDSQCSSITSQEITLLDGDMFQSCMEQSGSMNINEFQACLNDSEINGNIATLGSSGWIVTKETVGSFGSLTYFMPEGDQNIPVFFETTNYPQVCSAQGNTYCVDDNIYGLNFNQLNEAIAEVGQVNIKNVDNPLKPIQVEIPVQIEETVCSAYRFANENYWYPTQIPQGYSDFDAMTQIDLLIQDSQGTTLLDDQVVIPIEAETCAGLSAFSWTPAAELEDEEVTFTVTTEVIDRQVITSLIDTASVTETIYPNNLDNTCWTRAYDFTLANEPTFDLTTSIAQIQQGEYLYAGFRAGAWRDESITPMQFEAILVFDNGDEETILTTFQDTSGLDLEEYFEDLSETVFDLQPGNYEVTLITRPIGTNCLTSEEVRQTQQLTILEVPKYSLDVYVSGNESQALENVQLQVVLEESRDEFQITPTYDETQTTNTQGYSEFTGLIAGTYTYTASLEGYSTVTNEVIVGSDTQLYINLPQENSAPIVDLPQEVTLYFEEAYELQLQDYIVDFNDAFNTLTIETSLVSGDASIQTINNVAEITTTTPNTVTISVSVED
ncbi:MAG: carboxypeptidase-like regulatory domain-containing protein, partial [Nanoarchaeota archaeon]|nr:carboxypeptidase-like regulatory domain-containing protein [Nanoarchaeota archaeon]